jgi:hypothetical protein
MNYKIKLCQKIDIKFLLKNINYKHQDSSELYKGSVNQKFNLFEKKEEDKDLEYFMIEFRDELNTLFCEHNEERFINELLFTKLKKEQYKYDFHKSVIEKLDNLISHKIASELFNENILESNGNTNLKKKTSKKKRNSQTNNSYEIKDIKEEYINLEQEKKNENEKISPINQQVEKFFEEFSHISKKESNEKDPNIKFLLQLENVDKKNKKLEQLLISKKTSTIEKEENEEVQGNQAELLKIIHTESVEEQSDISKESVITPKNKEILTVDQGDEAKSKRTEISESNENDTEEITRKKKKHRDAKKKAKNVNCSRDILNKLDKFQRTVSDNYKFPMANPKNNRKNPVAEEKKQEIEKVIEEEQIKLNKLEVPTQEIILSSTKVQNLTITKPPNDQNNIPEGVRSPFIQSTSVNQKVNSPFVSRTLNTEKMNSPFQNRQINIGDKVRSPFTNKFNDINNLANKVNKSPNTREEGFIPNQSQQQYYQNSNFYQPTENKNKFTNKYNSLQQGYQEQNDNMYMVNHQMRNPINNNFMYINHQYNPMITQNIAFNYGMGNIQFPMSTINDIPYNINFKKFELKERNFFNKLHNDILDYSNNINNINNSLKEIKLFLIKFVEKKLEEFLQKFSKFLVNKDLKINLNVYGSFRTELSIETSDIDLSINILNAYNFTKENITKLITELSVQFENLSLFDKVVALTNATVPIIKLVKFN